MRVLEAGCGSASYLAFPADAWIVGIDISELQLERNAHVHERIVGDIQTHEFAPDEFDAIVCWDVLEHVDDPGAALDRFMTALRPGGLLFLGVPDRDSIKGILTRGLPFRAHVWFYRRILRSQRAGTKDFGPFPTPMHASMARGAMIERLRGGRLHCILDIRYESPMMTAIRERFHMTGLAWRALHLGVHIVTLGHVTAETTECLLVFEKVPGG